MGKENIKMSHKEYREFMKGLFGVKKFKVDNEMDKLDCPYLKTCKSVLKNHVYCKLVSHKHCYIYLVNKVDYFNDIFSLIDSILKIIFQGHLNKNNDNGKCVINVNKGHTLQSNKKDARV